MILFLSSNNSVDSWPTSPFGMRNKSVNFSFLFFFFSFKIQVHGLVIYQIWAINSTLMVLSLPLMARLEQVVWSEIPVEDGLVDLWLTLVIVRWQRLNYGLSIMVFFLLGTKASRIWRWNWTVWRLFHVLQILMKKLVLTQPSSETLRGC